jgi:hypothetical protein
MPFIRGRYHINPVMGEALEAAREAEAALLALENAARQNGGDADGDSTNSTGAANNNAKGPVHRVEIEAAEMVPSHSGRAERGYAMRVHRLPAPDDDSSVDSACANGPDNSGQPRFGARNAASAVPGQSDTHIFSNHNDMLAFLRDELTSDSTPAGRRS